MTTISNLATYAVRTASGSFDVDATVEKFRSDCLRYVTARETEAGKIGEAVRAVFAEEVSLGGSLPMPFVQTKACTKLNAQSANYKDLFERVGDWIRENAQGEKSGKGADATYERPDSEFVINKGKGGGVVIRADRAAREAAEAAEAAAKAAAGKKLSQ